MPVNPDHYPPGWREFSDHIRFQRAAARCECHGQCGLHRGLTASRRCVESHGQPAHFAKGRVILTVAHLCTCDPICKEPSHVIAACQRCHLRIDRFRHARHRLLTQRHQRHALEGTPRPFQEQTKPTLPTGQQIPTVTQVKNSPQLRRAET